MQIAKYFKGEATLSSAVILNIIAITIVGIVTEYLIEQGYLSEIKSAQSLKELGQVLLYYIFVLPFDYIVWVCAKNAKKRAYLIVGRIFALKYVVLLLASVFRFVFS